jgi:hypothetical protein
MGFREGNNDKERHCKRVNGANVAVRATPDWNMNGGWLGDGRVDADVRDWNWRRDWTALDAKLPLDWD